MYPSRPLFVILWIYCSKSSHYSLRFFLLTHYPISYKPLRPSSVGLRNVCPQLFPVKLLHRKFHAGCTNPFRSVYILDPFSPPEFFFSSNLTGFISSSHRRYRLSLLLLRHLWPVKNRREKGYKSLKEWNASDHPSSYTEDYIFDYWINKTKTLKRYSRGLLDHVSSGTRTQDPVWLTYMKLWPWSLYSVVLE